MTFHEKMITAHTEMLEQVEHVTHLNTEVKLMCMSD